MTALIDRLKAWSEYINDSGPSPSPDDTADAVLSIVLDEAIATITRLEAECAALEASNKRFGEEILHLLSRAETAEEQLREGLEGWRLVPVEATRAMLVAGRFDPDHEPSKQVYRAMLSASPPDGSSRNGVETSTATLGALTNEGGE